MTFAVVAGCGGGEGNTAVDVPDDDGLPFADEDQASGNEDQPATNPDQPERNPDQPQVNPDQPPTGVSGGGGGLEGVCHAVCQVFDACDNQGGGLGILRAICERNCTVPGGGAIPCPTELGQYLSCLNASTTLCAAEQGAPAAEECAAAGQAFGRCADEQDEPGETPGVCTMAGGCENCGSQCATCVCEAGNDTDDLAACVMLDDCTGAMP
jgi:hypothetical protein